MKRILFFTLIILFDLGFAQVSTPYWGTSGITALSSHWLGTKNSQDLIFKVNNVEVARFGVGGTFNFSNGKNLSTEDFTTAFKNKLNALPTTFFSGSYLDLTNKPIIPLQFNPIAGTGISLSGTYPNITFNSNTGAGNMIASSINVANNTVLIFDTVYEIRYNSTTNNFEARVNTGTKAVSYLSENEYPGGSFSTGNQGMTLSTTWQTIGDPGTVANERQVVELTCTADNTAYRYVVQRISSTNVTMYVEKIGFNGSVVNNVVSLTGAFNASHNQTFTLTTTPQAVPFNTNDSNFGVISHSTTVNNTRFTFNRAGYYEIQAFPQINRIGVGEAVFWVRKNGNTNLANTAIRRQYSSNTENGTDIISGSDIFNVGDYIEIVGFSTNATSYNLLYTAGGTQNGISFPGTPAIIINIKGFYN